MKKRYQKQAKSELPSRQKLTTELAKTKAHAEWTSKQLAQADKDHYNWQVRACRAEQENQRLVKQIEGLSSFRRFVRVAPSPQLFPPEEMFGRNQRVSMPRYHVGVDFEVLHYEMKECRDREVFVETVADHIAREVRAAVIKNLQVI